jgi:hypothetical protein
MLIRLPTFVEFYTDGNVQDEITVPESHYKSDF